MNCIVCKGMLEEKLTTFMTEIDGTIIIIKNVPSRVCAQCGEVSYSTQVVRELTRLVDSMRSTITEIAIMHYPDKVA